MKKLPGVKLSQLTVYIPEELDLWLRQSALENGRTLSKQFERALRAGRTVLEQQRVA